MTIDICDEDGICESGDAVNAVCDDILKRHAAGPPRKTSKSREATFTLEATSNLEPVVSLFKLAADPTRLRILLLLEGGEKHVTALCEALGQTQPAVSHHLGLLRVSHVIERRRQGQFNHYSLAPKGETIVRAAHASHAVA